jgi:hypothetical protein
MFVLTYCNPGPEGLARGIAAAERYFADTGADPVAAWRAAENLSFGAAYDRDALRHWYSAEECAILAIYGRFRHAPGTAALEWRADPEPAPAPEPDGFPLGENPSW